MPSGGKVGLKPQGFQLFDLGSQFQMHVAKVHLSVLFERPAAVTQIDSQTALFDSAHTHPSLTRKTRAMEQLLLPGTMQMVFIFTLSVLSCLLSIPG